jgi:formylglycine-generating enzyme required for sulfatase activity
VIDVNWEDAQAYCRWLTAVTGKHYRLPSEAEWEYSCRAGTDTPFWWGWSISASKANYDGNYTYGGVRGKYRQRTVRVESFEANPWGLYQVHGNVWEWCQDIWHETYAGAPDDGSPWLQGVDASRRVLRGGSWFYNPQYLRSASRNKYTTDGRFNYFGFRVVRMLTA